MESDWTETTIGAVCSRVFSGGTPTSTNPAYFGGGIPWLRTKEVNYTKVYSTEETISEAGLAASAAKLVPVNAVIVAMYGNGDTAGRAAISKVPLTTNQACCNLIVDTAKADYRFVYYYLRSRYQALVDLKNGGAQQNLNGQVIKSFPIYLPRLATQADIADVFEALDDRIDLLRRTNVTLESIAQALFKSWFINFDPVRALDRGREPEGVDAATAALFPAEFEESALGLIPKGWQVRSLDSFANYLNGLAMQKFPPESEDEYLPVIKIAQLRAGNTMSSDRASARLKDEYVVRDGDVLFSWSGSLEVEFWCGGVGALNQHLFKVTSAEVPKWFYYLATRHFLPRFREIAAHKATTMGHIQRKHLTEARLALPPPPLMKGLGKVLGPLLQRRIANSLQARELAGLRDALLPRLISGQLRVPEVQAQLEEALA